MTNHLGNTKTQHEKIVDMCSDGNWHCQNAFRALYIFSTHKRRSEITDGKAKGIPFGQYFFIDKPCEHGVRGQKDYKMMTRQPVSKEEIQELTGEDPVDMFGKGGFEELQEPLL